MIFFSYRSIYSYLTERCNTVNNLIELDNGHADMARVDQHWEYSEFLGAVTILREKGCSIIFANGTQENYALRFSYNYRQKLLKIGERYTTEAPDGTKNVS